MTSYAEFMAEHPSASTDQLIAFLGGQLDAAKAEEVASKDAIIVLQQRNVNLELEMVTMANDLDALQVTVKLLMKAATTGTPSPSASPVLHRKFLDGISGSTVEMLLKSGSSNLDTDWTKITPKLINMVKEEIVWNSRMVVQEEDYYATRMPITKRDKVERPIFGTGKSTFKSQEQWVEYAKSIADYVNLGGNLSIMGILKDEFAIERFISEVDIQRHDLGVLTSKEALALLYFRNWRKPDYNKMISQIASLKLEYHGDENISASVQAYNIGLQKALEHHAFDKDIVKQILKTWSRSYSLWAGIVSDLVTEEKIDSWEKLGAWLKQQADATLEATNKGLHIKEPKNITPSKVAPVASEKKNIVAAALESPKGFPKEGFMCVHCDLPYTNVKNPDLSKFQTHGWATSWDGTKALCKNPKDQAKLDNWQAQRARDYAQQQASKGKKKP